MRSDGVALGDVLQVLAAQLAWFQAALLGAAAVDKIIRWSHTKSVAQRFAGVPPGIAAWTSVAAVALELAAAAWLVFPTTRTAGAATAALLWTVYLALLLRAIRANRRDVDCGCSFGGGHRPLGAFQLARNAALVMLALLVACVPLQAGSGGSALASQGLAACALLSLYAALDQVMALGPLRSGEVL